MSWKPQRTFAESKPNPLTLGLNSNNFLADAILCAAGSIHEVETTLVDGRLQRVYKNLWPSLRAFWLAAVDQYSHKTYIVFENQRLSYQEVHDRAIKAAAVFRNVYDVKKGLAASNPF